MDDEEEESFNSPISSKDVYDLAADIASEFEKVVGICGQEVLNPLVNRVISVLEHLETTVQRLQVAENYVTSLRQQISELQFSKISNAESKIKLEQDLADVEESWIAEIKDLKHSLSRVQEDNKHLQSLLKEQLCLEQTKEKISDLHLIQELQDIVASLNSRLKDKEFLVEEHISNIAILKSNLEQQDQLNKFLHEKIIECQAKVKTLWQDKTDLNATVRKQQEMLEILNHQLTDSMLNKHNAEQNGNYAQPFSSELKQKCDDESSNYYAQDKEILLLRIRDLEQELLFVKREADEYKKKFSGGSRLQQWHSLSSKGSAIRQLFRFFLGVVARETNNFRSQ